MFLNCLNEISDNNDVRNNTIATANIATPLCGLGVMIVLPNTKNIITLTDVVSIKLASSIIFYLMISS